MTWARLRNLLAGIGVDDGLGLAGASCVLYGVSTWSPAAAWVLGGVLLMTLAVWPALRKAK